MTGSRKFKVFIIGMIMVFLIILVAFFKDVPFTGDNVERLCWVVVIMVGIFTGGNANEWWAKAFNKGQPINEIK